MSNAKKPEDADEQKETKVNELGETENEGSEEKVTIKEPELEKGDDEQQEKQDGIVGTTDNQSASGENNTDDKIAGEKNDAEIDISESNGTG